MKTNAQFFKTPKTLLVLAIFFVNVHLMNATSSNWTGNVNSVWSNSGNWDNGVPGSSCDAVIDPSHYTGAAVNPALDASGLKCNNLSIAWNATLSSAAGTDLTVSGNLGDLGLGYQGTLTGAGGTIYVAGNINLYYMDGIGHDGTLTVILNGTTQNIYSWNTYFYNLTIVSGTTTISGGTGNLYVGGTMTVNSPAILDPGGSPVLGGGTLTGNGTLNVDAQDTWNDFLAQYQITTLSLSDITVDFRGSGRSNTVDASFSCKNIIITNLAGVYFNAANSTNVIVTASGNLSGGGVLNAPGSGGYTTTINIGGNMTVSSFTANNSTVVLDGTGAQNINGYALNNLTINGSGETITLNGNESVAGTLTMTTGNINTGSYTLTLGTAIGTPGTLSYTAGFVIGSFERWFTTSTVTIGTVAGLFPMGTSADTRNCWIAGTPSSGGTVIVVFTSVSGTTTFGSYVENGIITVTGRNNSSWAITTANSFAETSGGLSVRFEAANLGGVTDITKLTLSFASGLANGTFSAASGSNSDFKIDRTGLTASNMVATWYVAGDLTTNPLPVTLTSFNALFNAGIVDIKWQTATEINNNYFNIERSINRSEWVSIGKVEGHGNSNIIQNYMDIDNLEGTIPLGTFYYRLKQVDFNGKYSYSEIRAVKLDNDLLTTALYPSPAQNTINVVWTSVTDNFTILKITNMSGETLYNKTVTGFGKMQKQIDLSSYPAGAYSVLIINGFNTISRIIIKN